LRTNNKRLDTDLRKDLEKGPLPEEVVKTLDEAWIIAKAGKFSQCCRSRYARFADISFPESTVYYHGELKYGYDTQKALFG